MRHAHRPVRRTRLATAAALLFTSAAIPAFAQSTAAAAAPATTDADAPQRSGGIVTIVGTRPSSLPTYLPTTIESITAAEIARSINATDAEDALKYFPSLLVRKRYIGDYNHAVLSSRASGTGNSARSAVYADGILLSNFLGNGAGFTPRWGLVTPEEIERVDVLYGPFSAAYPGNSVGAVVDYVTRMPRQFEAHLKIGGSTSHFQIWNTDQKPHGSQASASIGSREGAFSWWINVNRLDSVGQALTFTTKLASATTTAAGTPVTGAVLSADKSNIPWWILGDATNYHTVQDHAKLKLAYDFGDATRAYVTLGWWDNTTRGQSNSYLRKSSDGSVVTSGVITLDGRNYSLGATDFPQNRDRMQQLMHGLSIKRSSGGTFDWELAASAFDYVRDALRSPTVAKPAADSGGAGRETNGEGTGWQTLAAKGVWRPNDQHRADFGVQADRYMWRQRIDNLADWLAGAPTTPLSSFSGNTALQAVFAQDAWTLNDRLKALLGLRWEHWTATGGRKVAYNQTTVAPTVSTFQDRSEQWLSPKAALGWQVNDLLALKFSTGRAVRAPTVGELFQGNAGTDAVTNPNLRPEKGWTSELSTEWALGEHRLRVTGFHENTRDALYSQSSIVNGATVTSVQNIGRIRTLGLETALSTRDLWVKGLDLQASLTYADSKIVENSGYVATPGDTIGKQQPRVPRWRASLLAAWRVTDALTASLGARYGSRQYGTLNNSDPNGFAYQGFSSYFSADARLHWRINRQWSASVGVDNLNNQTYWNFHPYPQRTTSAEVRFDL